MSTDVQSRKAFTPLKPSSRAAAGKAERKRRIVHSAAELLSELNGQIFSMQALSAKAGVSLQTIYNLVGSQNDVLSAILNFEDDPPLTPAEGAEEQAFSRLLSGYVHAAKRMIARPKIHRTAMLLLSGQDLREFFERHMQLVLPFFMTELGRGLARGDFSHDLPVSVVAHHLQTLAAVRCLDWAFQRISDEEFLQIIETDLVVTLLAIATPVSRGALLEHIAALPKQATDCDAPSPKPL